MARDHSPQERQRKHARQRRKGLQFGLSEDRGHGRDVESARRRNHQKNSKDVRQAPDNLVVHPGHDVAMMFHVGNGAQSSQRNQREQTEQTEVATGIG